MIEKTAERNITVNRKARHEYFIIQAYEAGISLLGTEVKALRQNKANLVDSYAVIENGEIWLINSNIGIYDHGNINNHEPLRKRKLLFKKSEIRKLIRSVKEKGNTLIPLRLYFKGSKVKVELATATGKRKYDRREDIAKRDAQRESNRKIKF